MAEKWRPASDWNNLLSRCSTHGLTYDQGSLKFHGTNWFGSLVMFRNIRLFHGLLFSTDSQRDKESPLGPIFPTCPASTAMKRLKTQGITFFAFSCRSTHTVWASILDWLQLSLSTWQRQILCFLFFVEGKWKLLYPFAASSVSVFTSHEDAGVRHGGVRSLPRYLHSFHALSPLRRSFHPSLLLSSRSLKITGALPFYMGWTLSALEHFVSRPVASSSFHRAVQIK